MIVCPFLVPFWQSYMLCQNTFLVECFNDFKTLLLGSEYVTASPDPALLAIRKVFWCRKTFPRSSFLSAVSLAKTFLFWDIFFTAEYMPLLIPILTFDFIALFFMVSRVIGETWALFRSSYNHWCWTSFNGYNSHIGHLRSTLDTRSKGKITQLKVSLTMWPLGRLIGRCVGWLISWLLDLLEVDNQSLQTGRWVAVIARGRRSNHYCIDTAHHLMVTIVTLLTLGCTVYA